MKTTIELPDDLFIEAKTVAARRRTSLKALIEHALRREIAPPADFPPDSPYDVGPFGILSIKKRAEPMSAKKVQHFIDHQYDEEDARILQFFEKP